MFVDDEPRVLESLATTLKHTRACDWEMHFAEDGASAMIALAQVPFDALVADIRMPGMDGLDLLHSTAVRHPGMVRMVLSGFAPSLSVFGILSHAHGFLAKPCRPDALADAVARKLALRERIGDQSLRNLVLGLESLLLMPATYSALGRAVKKRNATDEDLQEVVMSDIGLTAEILRMAYFAVRQGVEAPGSASAALDSVGPAEAAGMFAAGVLHPFPAGAVEIFGIDRIVEHSLQVCSAAVEMIQKKQCAGVSPRDAVLAAFLHDIGKLAIIEVMPERYDEASRIQKEEKVSFTEAERRVLGWTHAEAGGYLLALWGLPEELTEAIARHHDPVQSEATPLARLLFAANNAAHGSPQNPD